jgi:hypothetical protein
MTCLEFREQAWRWMEGEQMAAFAAHAESCTRCRALVADLEGIHQAARQLGKDDPAPPSRLWTAIRAQLEAEGRIRQPGWLDRLTAAFIFVPRPALAAASFAVLFVLTASLTLPTSVVTPFEPVVLLSEPAPTIVQMREKVDLAGRRAAAMISTGNPIVAASYRQNLAIVDKAIDMCEKAVREEPGNELAREYFYGALRQKAELVATMMERNTLGE